MELTLVWFTERLYELKVVGVMVLICLLVHVPTEEAWMKYLI